MATAIISNKELRANLAKEMDMNRATIKSQQEKVEENKRRIMYSYTEEEAALPGDEGWWACHQIANREFEEVNNRSLEEHVMRISPTCTVLNREDGRETAMEVAMRVANDPQFKRLFKSALKRCEIVSDINYRPGRDDNENECECDSDSESE